MRTVLVTSIEPTGPRAMLEHGKPQNCLIILKPHIHITICTMLKPHIHITICTGDVYHHFLCQAQFGEDLQDEE